MKNFLLMSTLVRWMWPIPLALAAIGTVIFLANERRNEVFSTDLVAITSYEMKPVDVARSYPHKQDPSSPIATLADRALEDSKTVLRAKLQHWSRRTTGDDEAESRLLEEMLALLSDQNVAAFNRLLSAEERGTPFGLAALKHWLRVDSQKAAFWIGAQTDTNEQQALLVANELLKDPACLRLYCDELPVGEWKQHVLKNAALEMAAQNPAEAIGLVGRLTSEAVQMDVLQTVSYAWVIKDPGPALDWINAITETSLREGLVVIGAKAIAATDPDLAADWLVPAIKSEKILNDTALYVVEAWVAQHPAKAANWVAHLPLRDVRDAAVSLVLDRWSQMDAAAATAWLMTLPERDKILARLKVEQAERQRPPDLDL